MNDKLMTVAEVAELTRLPLSTIRWFRHAGKGPRSARLGKRVVYKQSDVLAWIEAQFALEGRGEA